MRLIKEMGMIVMEIILFLGILGLTFTLIAGGFVALDIVDPNHVDGPTGLDPYIGILSDYLPLMVGAIVGIVLVHRIIFKRPFRFSGIGTSRLFPEVTIGISWSFLLLTLGFVLLYVIGMIEIEKTDFNAYLFIGFFLFFIFQSTFEELVLRAFLLPTIANYTNIWIGIIGSSLVFTLLHISNANISLLSLLNIFLAGILLGVIFIRYGQIWAPIGLHAGWNFLQGSFYGFEVSGLDVYSYIDSKETGPDLITGGAFGFEGSIISTLFIMAASLWIWRSAPEKYIGNYQYSNILINEET